MSGYSEVLVSHTIQLDRGVRCHNPSKRDKRKEWGPCVVQHYSLVDYSRCTAKVAATEAIEETCPVEGKVKLRLLRVLFTYAQLYLRAAVPKPSILFTTRTDPRCITSTQRFGVPCVQLLLEERLLSN